MLDYSFISFNFALLLRELESRNIVLSFLGNTDLIMARLDNHIEYFNNYLTRLTPAIYNTIFQDKYYSKVFLQTHGISVAPGQVFTVKQYNEALQYAKTLGFPVVLKPVAHDQGHYVFANITTEKEFRNAYEILMDATSVYYILVEKFFAGDDYRFLVIADKDLAVIKRSAPKIIGDGLSTIREIVEAENYKRLNPRVTCLCTIKIDSHECLRTLAKQGMNLDSIPKANQEVLLRNNANVSVGASCENVLDSAHPSYLDLARKIHALLPGNSVTCIDLLAYDITVPLKDDEYVFCEFTVDPGFSLHEMPGHGQPHSVVSSIVDLLFPETSVTKTKSALKAQNTKVDSCASIEQAANYPKFAEQGLVFIQNPSKRSYQTELDAAIRNENFSDLVLVSSLSDLASTLKDALHKTFSKNSPFSVQLLVDDIYQTLKKFMQTFNIDSIEMHLQRRKYNTQPWHNDNTGQENKTQEFTINLAETLSGTKGTLAILNNCIRRQDYMDMRATMDNLHANNENKLFEHWNSLKEHMCNRSPIIEIPVGQLFLFTTGRQYGLIHKPPLTNDWRLFMKAREATSRTAEYLTGLNHPTSVVNECGYVIKKDRGWV